MMFIACGGKMEVFPYRSVYQVQWREDAVPCGVAQYCTCSRHSPRPHHHPTSHTDKQK